MLKNPLDVEVNLANLTVNVETTNATNDLEIETIDSIYLQPKESRVVSICLLLYTNPVQSDHVGTRYLCLLSHTGQRQ